MNRATFDFTGAQVLVTGGTSGIGFAIATTLADAGAVVTVTGRRASPEEYGTALERFGYRQLEMTDPGSIDRLVGSLSALDVLVNNAGANLPGGRDEWEPDTFSTAVALNLTGPMRLTVGCHDLLSASSLEGGDVRSFVDRVHDQARVRGESTGARIRLQQRTPAPLPTAEAA